jgi:hypothetical protein
MLLRYLREPLYLQLGVHLEEVPQKHQLRVRHVHQRDVGSTPTLRQFFELTQRLLK